MLDRALQTTSLPPQVQRRYIYLGAALVLVLLYSWIHDALTRTGDFGGYLVVGEDVLVGRDIYTDPLINTWPPFFSLLCVPLALAARVWRSGLHLVWLLGSLASCAYLVYCCARLSWSDFRRSDWWHPWVLLPVVLSLRLVLDNLANLQINTYLLALCVGAVYAEVRGKPLLGGALLGFAIACKIFPLVFAAVLLPLRPWRLYGVALLTAAVCCALPFAVYGPAEAQEQLANWSDRMLSGSITTGHKNQSLLASLQRLLSPVDGGGDYIRSYYAGLQRWNAKAVQTVLYAVYGVLGTATAAWLWRLVIPWRTSAAYREVAFLIAALAACLSPLMSPLAWKAFFIFTLPAVFLGYQALFGAWRNTFTAGALRTLVLGLWIVGTGLLTFSSELFLGKTVSDYAEVYGALTWGALMLVVALLLTAQQRFGAGRLSPKLPS